MTRQPPPLPAYALHRDFVSRAGDAIEPWRTALGAFLFILAFVFLPPMAASFFLWGTLQDDFFEGRTALGVLIQFGSMILPILALQQIGQHLHGRGLWSMVGRPTRAIQLGWDTAKITFAVLLVIELAPPWPETGTFSVVRPLLPWILTFPFALVVIGIQVTGEELFFRGYLQQQIAARASSPLYWMWAPSLLFGAAHYFNADGPAEGVLWAFWATGLGLVGADLTARSGSVGPAIAVHFVNNLFALLLYGMENGPSSGLALMLTPYVDPASYDNSLSLLGTPSGLFEILLITLEVMVLWYAGRLAIRR